MTGTMRASSLSLSLVILMPALLVAEEAASERRKRVELGAGLAGFSVTSFEGQSLWTASTSGADLTLLRQPRAYAAFFVSPSLAVRPELGVTYWSGGGETAHSLSLAGQVDWLFRTGSGKSPYVFGGARFHKASLGASRYGAGGGLGYRIPIGDRGVVRLEGRYDRSFESDHYGALNTFSANVSVGVKL